MSMTHGRACASRCDGDFFWCFACERPEFKCNAHRLRHNGKTVRVCCTCDDVVIMFEEAAIRGPVDAQPTADDIAAQSEGLWP